MTSKFKRFWSVALVVLLVGSFGTGTGRAFADDNGQSQNSYLIGTNYFSGWWKDPNIQYHIPNPPAPRLEGPDWRTMYPEREPKYGWFDDEQQIMDQEIVDASASGIDFFVFGWFPDRPGRGEGVGVGVNNGYQFFMNSPENDRMKFTISYNNHNPFTIQYLRTPDMSQAEWEQLRAEEWEKMTDQWIELFKNPRYLKIDGKPVMQIFNVQTFQQDFSTGTRDDLNPHELAQIPEERQVLLDAVDRLREKVKAAGFPDVLFGGGLDQPGFDGEYVQAHDDGAYDFFTAYNRIPTFRVTEHHNSIYNLVRDHHDYVWDYYDRYKRPDTDYVPVISWGWDKVINPSLPIWDIGKTPENFGNFLREAREYLDEHPQTNMSSGSPVKMAIIASWNELGEGHYIIPTKADGDQYTRQVGKVFGYDDLGGQIKLRYRDWVSALSDWVGFWNIPASLQAMISSIGDIPSEWDSSQNVQTLLQQIKAVKIAVGKVLQYVDWLPVLSEEQKQQLSALSEQLLEQNEALFEAALGINVFPSVDDYSPVRGQQVHFKLQMDSSLTGSRPMKWKVVYPEAWGYDPAQVEGVLQDGSYTGEMDFQIPDVLPEGDTIHINGVLPGVSSLEGMLQQLTVHVELKENGEWMETEVPLPLTILPDYDSRVTAQSFDGDANHARALLHNLKPSSLTGTLRVDHTQPGIECDPCSYPVNLAGDAKGSYDFAITNETGSEQSVTVYLDQNGVSHPLGDLVLEPKQETVVVDPTRDGTINSNDKAILTSAERLQVGTASGLEYRPVLSFDIGSLTGKTLDHVLLNLTEFEHFQPGAVALEHLDQDGAITTGLFDQVALDSMNWLDGADSHVVNQSNRLTADVTAWVADDLANGRTHSTFRIVMPDADKSYPDPHTRAFRPVEYTPDDPEDAPVLSVIAH